MRCARCGGDAEWVECESCDEFGMSGHDCGEDSCCCEYPDDNVSCQRCEGVGGWWLCGNSAEWCMGHPMPGRENVEGGLEAAP